MKKILILTSTNGHQSMAVAIQEQLSSKYEVVIETYINSNLERIYTPFYLFFPQLFKLLFTLGKSKFIFDIFEKRNTASLSPIISGYIEKHRPDLVINTFGFFSATCGMLCLQKKIPSLNVIADPFTPQPSFISPKMSYTALFDESTVSLAQEQKVGLNQIFISGWFTRQKFFEKYDQKKMREELHLRTEALTLLVTGGAEGTFYILKVLFALLFVKKKYQIIFACGHNKLMYFFLRLVSKIVPKEMHIHPIKFTIDMDKYMKASDLVIGKCGPNLLFESVAVNKPFLAITHISGQEDGNLFFLVKAQLGIVEENPLKLGKLLRSILDHPQSLDKFRGPLQTMAFYNMHSGQRLREFVQRII
ncbi:MAG TPA: glycosyltransferase [Patescibacteria group bacterium]|nr:glycosyltransferase [Patescibacteria group bacterium]